MSKIRLLLEKHFNSKLPSKELEKCESYIRQYIKESNWKENKNDPVIPTLESLIVCIGNGRLEYLKR